MLEGLPLFSIPLAVHTPIRLSILASACIYCIFGKARVLPDREPPKGRPALLLPPGMSGGRFDGDLGTAGMLCTRVSIAGACLMRSCAMRCASRNVLVRSLQSMNRQGED